MPTLLETLDFPWLMVNGQKNPLVSSSQGNIFNEIFVGAMDQPLIFRFILSVAQFRPFLGPSIIPPSICNAAIEAICDFASGLFCRLPVLAQDGACVTATTIGDVAWPCCFL